jgi:branched-chain amino acid aminotransferase
MGQFIFINGKYRRVSAASIPVNDAGFLYGDGLYETFKSHNGYIFSIGMHIGRLFGSMQALGYNPDFSAEDIMRLVYGLLRVNRLDKCRAYIKIIVTRNSYENRFNFSYKIRPSLVIISNKLKPYPEIFYEKGIAVFSSSIKRNASGNELHRHKLLSYFENIYAKNEAYANQAQEAIFLTRDKVVLEGASSNIFAVKANKVFTTPLSQDILPGITRKTVLELCSEHKISYCEKRLHYFNLLEADEVFITSSIMGIMPVSKIDCHNINEGSAPGIITGVLSGFYRDLCLK